MTLSPEEARAQAALLTPILNLAVLSLSDGLDADAIKAAFNLYIDEAWQLAAEESPEVVLQGSILQRAPGVQQLDADERHRQASQQMRRLQELAASGLIPPILSSLAADGLTPGPGYCDIGPDDETMEA